jgi:hypothetical protein
MLFALLIYTYVGAWSAALIYFYTAAPESSLLANVPKWKPSWIPLILLLWLPITIFAFAASWWKEKKS